MPGKQAQDYLASLRQQYLMQLGGAKPSRRGPSWAAGQIESEPTPEWYADPNNALGRTIDIVSRPVYAIGNYLKDVIDSVDYQAGRVQRGEGLDIGNILHRATLGIPQSLGSGLAGRSKVLPSDAIFDRLMPEGPQDSAEGTARFAIGLGLDLALDPLTYVGVGALSKIPGVASRVANVRKVRGAKKRDALPEEVSPSSVPERPTATPDEPAPLPGRPFEIDPLSPSPNATVPVRIPGTGRTIRPNMAAPNAAPQFSADDLLKRLDERKAEEAAKVQANKELVKQGKLVPKPPSARDDVVQRILDGEIPGRPLLSSLGPQIVRQVVDKTFDDYQQFAKVVREEAAVPRTLDGKRVYDVDDIDLPPSLARKAEEEAARKAAESAAKKAAPDKPVEPGEWVRINAGRPVFMTKNGLSFDPPASGVRVKPQTLGEFIAKNRKASPKETQRAISGLYHAYVKAFRPDPSSVSQQVAEALGAAPRASQGPARSRALREKAVNEWAEKYNFAPEDRKFLLAARSIESFQKRVQEVLSRERVPIDLEDLSRPDDPIVRALLEDIPGINVPETPIAGTAAGANVPKVTAPVAPIQPSQDAAEIVNRVIDTVRKYQFAAPDDKFTRRTKVHRTRRDTDKAGEGLGINDRGWNSRAEYTAFRMISSEVSGQAKKLGLIGLERARYMRENVLRLLDEKDAVLRSHGIEPILGNGNKGKPLSMGDVIRALPEEVTHRHLFDRLNHPTVAPTNLLDSVNEILSRLPKNANQQEVMRAAAELRKQGKGKGSFWSQLTGVISGSPLPHGWTESAMQRAREAGKMVKRKGITQLQKTKPVWKTINGKRVKVEGSRLVESGVSSELARQTASTIADALLSPAFIKNIYRASTQNAARYGARFNYEVPELTRQVIDDFMRAFDSGSVAQTVAAYDNLGEATAAAAKAMNAMPGSARVAEGVIEATATEVLGPNVSAIQRVKRGANAMRDGTREAQKRAGLAQNEAAAAEIIDEIPFARVDLDIHAEFTMDNAILRAVFPFKGKDGGLFNGLLRRADRVLSKLDAAAGTPTLHAAHVASSTTIRSITAFQRRQLTNIVRMGKDISEPAFEAVRRGTPINDIPDHLRKAAEEFQSITEQLFGSTQDGLLGAFFRNGYDIEHINAAMRAYKLPDSWVFDVKAAEEAAKISGRKVAEELADQWRKWDIPEDFSKHSNSVGFLASMQSTLVRVAGESETVRSMYRIMEGNNLASATRRKGFVQLTDSSGKSIMARYLPENAWYAPEIVQEIKAIDRVLTESKMLSGEFGKFVNTWVDPFLNMWKSGVTIWRPGHHLRNLIGDLSLTYLAEGLPKRNYLPDVMKVMALRKGYDGFDAIRVLQGRGPVNAAKIQGGQDIVARFTMNGKKVELTAEQVHEAARRNGILLDFASGEDLLENIANPSIQRVQEALQITGGRARQTVGTVSEARDHTVRLAHFLQAVEKVNVRGAKSVDDILDEVARKVRRWHPDGTDLSTFESKVMRRIFPFYSWSRKALPLVIESMVMHPGRVMAYPKAVYNFAHAAGVDPDSIANPFPQDQLFPSFLTENMTGPVASIRGNYYGFRPGVVQDDVLSEFASDPKGGVLNMLNPFLKTPIELLAQRNLATGADIRDTSEYLESQIPGVSHASTLSGVSVLGTLANMLPGSPESGIDPKRAVERGERGYIDPSALLSYLMGVQAQNMSRPSYQTIAEREEQERRARRGN